MLLMAPLPGGAAAARRGGRQLARQGGARQDRHVRDALCEHREAAVPIVDSELNRYLVDQDSPIGLLTRVGPAVGLDKTPAYVDRAGSSRDPRHSRSGWGPDLMVPHAVPHRPTSIFRLGLARRRGSQTL
jgi:hypothetical protein